MLFSDPVFFAFFAVYFCCHLAVPQRFRIYLIIVGGLFFYQYWKPVYVWLPLFLIAISYFGAAFVDAAENPTSRKRRLIFVLAGLVAPLIFFKYTNFLYANFVAAFSGAHEPIVDVSLPLGISFITFTLIAYVVDIFKRTYTHEDRVSSVASYVLFFPHLIAGPILRPGDLIPQLKNPRSAFAFRPIYGVFIFVVGLVKKLVFADQIGVAVDRVYAAPHAVQSSLEILIALYGFAVQIYCDFSGYTDMAIGLALLLGVKLPNNFNQPYLAASVADFWRRWHITLSHWLRDYIYIPLGGNRDGYGRQALYIMATMGLGGLWHGANWTFVVWGLLHGTGIVFSHLWRRIVPAGRTWTTPRALKIFVTFHFVVIAWVFFRAPDLTTARDIFAGLMQANWQWSGDELMRNAFVIVLIVGFFMLHRIDRQSYIRYLCARSSALVLWPIVIGLSAIAIALSAGSSAKFIYFDF